MIEVLSSSSPKAVAADSMALGWLSAGRPSKDWISKAFGEKTAKRKAAATTSSSFSGTQEPCCELSANRVTYRQWLPDDVRAPVLSQSKGTRSYSIQFECDGLSTLDEADDVNPLRK